MYCIYAELQASDDCRNKQSIVERVAAVAVI